jgi:hypothetical protein
MSVGRRAHPASSVGECAPESVTCGGGCGTAREASGRGSGNSPEAPGCDACAVHSVPHVELRDVAVFKDGRALSAYVHAHRINAVFGVHAFRAGRYGPLHLWCLFCTPTIGLVLHTPTCRCLCF